MPYRLAIATAFIAYFSYANHRTTKQMKEENEKLIKQFHNDYQILLKYLISSQLSTGYLGTQSADSVFSNFEKQYENLKERLDKHFKSDL